MPLRHASMQHQLHQNGVRLHAAMMSRIHSHGADNPPSEEELQLLEERRQLKAQRDERREHDQQPKANAPKLVRTTHATAKPKEAKVAREKEAKAAKKAKPHMTRTEKHAQKAAALDAARRASKKSASKT
jgi:hypothetical protein